MDQNYEMSTMTGPTQDNNKGQHITPSKPISITSNPAHETHVLADRSKRSTWRTTLILIALFLSLFVAALDATIVATAVPIMVHDLNSPAGYIWVGGAYLLANCAAGPIWAKVSDIWGRRPVLLFAIAVFIAGSIVCGVAETMPILIAGRALQGSAGGALILLVHVCISDLFSVRRRTLIMGLTEGVWACAGGVGPILGGVFASVVSWRWCFWINLPICGIAFVLILLFLDIQHESTSFRAGMKAIDWFGVLTFLGFTLMLLLGLDFGGAIFPWSSAKVIALLVVGSILVFVFVYGEAKIARYPLIPLDLFKQRSNVGSLLVTFFHGLVFMNTEYYLPLFLQSILGATPLLSGLLLLPFIVPGAIAGIMCGFVIHKTGRSREIIWIGTFLLLVGSSLSISWTANTTLGVIVGFQIITGVGSGILFEPTLIAIQSQVRQQDVATATATFSFVRNVAITLSVVIGGTLFQNSMDHRATFLADAGIPPAILEKLSGKNATANIMLGHTLTDPAQAEAVREAFAWSMRNLYILFTVLAFCGALSSLLVKSSHLASEHTETVTGIRTEEKTDSRNTRLEHVI